MQTKRIAKQGSQTNIPFSHIFVSIKGLQVALCHMQNVNVQNHSRRSHFCGISARYLSTVSKMTALHLHLGQITESRKMAQIRRCLKDHLVPKALLWAEIPRTRSGFSGT